ncbi:membrane protein [Kineosporia sp. NBRC 101677]|nr:membrane protein [Kineosporia sp. NBRC 101677]
MVSRARAALSGLTTRGRSFLSAGVASGICAVVLGRQDLLRIAVLLLVLPLACVYMLTRAHYRIGLTRTTTPARVSVGAPMRVRLELQNLASMRTRVLLAEDRVPPALGAPPRFVLDRMPGGQRAAVTYSLTAAMRGRYPIGPLRLRVTDPFGMCELTRSFTGNDHVTVVPRLYPLVPLTAGGTWGGAGDSLARAAAVSGEDDIATREYREGDDLRRVHWRSTAKRGELMVRREEQPRQMRATVVLDTRARAHRGEGPSSSFEWAVSAAASVAVHFAEEKHGIRLLLDGRPANWSNPHSGEASGELLERLAMVQTGGDEALDDAIGVLHRAGGDGLIIAVLGEIDESTALRLGELGLAGRAGIAVLLNTPEWSAGAVRGSAQNRQRVAGLLREGGWAVVEAGPEQSIADLWSGAAGTAAAAGAEVHAPRVPAGGAHPTASASTNGHVNGSGGSGDGFGRLLA